MEKHQVDEIYLLEFFMHNQKDSESLLASVHYNFGVKGFYSPGPAHQKAKKLKDELEKNPPEEIPIVKIIQEETEQMLGLKK